MSDLKLKIVNNYGNVDLTNTVLPKRYKHVKGNRLQPLCRKLKMKYAEAVVGFKRSRKYGYKPVTDGVVVSIKSEEKLLHAVAEREKRAVPPEKAKERREKAKLARERRKQESERKRAEQLASVGIGNPESRAAQWYEEGEIDEYEAQLIQFKTYYRHVHTDYDEVLVTLRGRVEYGDLQAEARDQLTEQPIPSTWPEYLGKYNFPYPEIATRLSEILQHPQKAHPVWFCKAIIALAEYEVSLENLTYSDVIAAIRR